MKQSEDWYFSTWQISMIYRHKVLLAHSILILPPTTFHQLSWGTKPRKSLCGPWSLWPLAEEVAWAVSSATQIYAWLLRDQPSVSRSGDRAPWSPRQPTDCRSLNLSYFLDLRHFSVEEHGACPPHLFCLIPISLVSALYFHYLLPSTFLRSFYSFSNLIFSCFSIHVLKTEDFEYDICCGP